MKLTENKLSIQCTNLSSWECFFDVEAKSRNQLSRKVKQLEVPYQLSIVQPRVYTILP